MSLPRNIPRCNGVEWDPFGVEPDCLDCLRRTQGIADYVAGADVEWMDAPAQTPCPERLAPKKERHA